MYSENWKFLDYVFYVFLNATSKKRKKSRFLDLKKNVKNVFLNYAHAAYIAYSKGGIVFGSVLSVYVSVCLSV